MARCDIGKGLMQNMIQVPRCVRVHERVWACTLPQAKLSTKLCQSTDVLSMRLQDTIAT